MEIWKFKCVGCNKTVRVTCNNCSYQKFKGKGSKKTDNSGTRYYLECQNCKTAMSDFDHNCAPFVEGMQRSRNITTTNIDRNRDNFIVSEWIPKKRGGRISGGAFAVIIFVLICFIIIMSL